MKQHTIVNVVGVNADGTPYTGTMLEANYGVNKTKFEEWGLCTLCGFAFPLSELRTVKGKLYCSKNKCIEDTMPKEQK